MINIELSEESARTIEGALRFLISSLQDDLGQYPNDGDAPSWAEQAEMAQAAFDYIHTKRIEQADAAAMHAACKEFAHALYRDFLETVPASETVAFTVSSEGWTIALKGPDNRGDFVRRSQCTELIDALYFTLGLAAQEFDLTPDEVETGALGLRFIAFGSVDFVTYDNGRG